MSDNERDQGGGEQEEAPKNPEQITIVIRDQVRPFLLLLLLFEVCVCVCVCVCVILCSLFFLLLWNTVLYPP
jgi:hypothetical protein